MKPILVWIKKDLGEIKWYAIVWVLFLITKAFFLVMTFGHSSHDALGIFQSVTLAFQGLLIGQIFLNDPFQGTKAFWITRPFSSSQWLTEKFSLLVFFILIPATLVDSLIYFLSALPISWTIEILIWQLFMTIPLLLGIAFLSFLVERRMQFYGLAALITSITLLETRVQFWRLKQEFPKIKPLLKFWESGTIYGNVSEWATLDILQGTFMSVGLCLLIASYLCFRTKWVHFCLLFIVVVVVPKGIGYGMIHSKINLFADAEREYQQKLERNDPKLSPILVPRLIWNDSTFEGGIEFQCERLRSGEWIRPYYFRSSDEDTQFYAQYNSLHPGKYLGNPLELHVEIISKLLSDAKFLGEKSENHDRYGALWKLKEKRGIPRVEMGALKISGDYELCRYKKAFEVRASNDAVLESRGIKVQWWPYKALESNSIMIKEFIWESPFRFQPATPSERSVNQIWDFKGKGETSGRKSNLIYALYNESKNEFVLPQVPESERWRWVYSTQYSPRFRSNLKVLKSLGIDDAWIKESKLVAVETVVEGRGKFEYSIPYQEIIPLMK